MARKEVKTPSVRWIHITQPDQKDMDRLQKEFDFHPLDLSDSLSKTQRPKMDIYDKYVFMVLHFPTLDPKTRRIRTKEINLFVGPKFFVTIIDKAYPALDGAFHSCQEEDDFREAFMNRGPGYLLYRVIHPLFRDIFSVVDKVGEYLNVLEKSIYDEDETVSAVKEIAHIQRMLLRMRATMDPQRSLIDQLVNMKRPFLGKDSEVYFDDVHDHVERISAVLATQSNVVESLHRVNESLISHRTNEIIKTLTLISAALLPLTLITGIYGMNVLGLPFADQPWSFVFTSIVLIVVLGAIVFVFRKKNWL